jgi:hypothetical protein
MERPAYVSSLVAPFARQVLAHELPGLPPDRLEAVIPFVLRRVDGLPSPIRVGVLLVAVIVRSAMMIPLVGARVPVFLATRPLPVVGEYARLVRSLGFAFVFEEWPDSRADGAPPVVMPA